jgi:transposase-like protein
MPHQGCSICQHPDLASIEAALNAGDSVREVAKRFVVSPAAVHRHQHHGDRARNRINTGEMERINAEIRKLHLAQTNARKRRDNELALQIARELRNWFILKRKAELATLPIASENTAEGLSPADALQLAKSVIESRIDDPDVRAWLVGLVERIPATPEV